MDRTIAFVGARGGHGTTTVAAVTALHLARTSPTVLVSELATAGALLGVSGASAHGRIDVTGGLALTDRHSVEAVTAVVDEGTLAAGPRAQRARIDERYLVLRGPCYLALTSVLAADVGGIDGIVLVEEAHRSLSAADVTDVLGLPVAATVTVSPQVARAIDAGLLPARFARLRDLAALRSLGLPAPGSTTPPRSTAKHVTDLPLSLCDNGAERDRGQIRVASEPSGAAVGRVWRPRPGRPSAEHRAAGSRCGRLLRRRGRDVRRGLLLGPG